MGERYKWFSSAGEIEGTHGTNYFLVPEAFDVAAFAKAEAETFAAGIPNNMAEDILAILRDQETGEMIVSALNKQAGS